jgi:hypothetical protein
LIRYAFVTVTDYDFFPGTLATVSSVLEFHPHADVYVVNNEKRGLSEPQAACLDRHPQVRLLNSSQFARDGRYINAWELKAYAAHDLAEGYEVIIGIDSDCLLCAKVDDQIERAHATGGFLGGQDGEGADYDDSYRAYGIETPARNPRYMSTSLFFCAVTAPNKRVLRRWTECCNEAVFNGTGSHPGHGDQGVLNAVLFAENAVGRVELLENRLWSQHWVYWDSIIDFHDGLFVNLSASGQRQRSFHCGGAEKFWAKDHVERVLDAHALQTYPYVWFLSMFWFGACREWSLDPLQYLPLASHHLVGDLTLFMPQIQQVYAPARALWNELTDPMIERVLNGIPRALSLGGSMTEVMQLVAAHPFVRRYVEIGSYEGGSILALGLRFANRDIDFYSVESFMGNMNGTMDGHRLPSRRAYLDNLARFPHLRVRLVPGASALAAQQFDNGGVDFLFIDACHETPAVLSDIDSWRPKLTPGAIIAGDDYGWESVRRAVDARFPGANVTPSGNVWWLRLSG